MRTFTCSTCTIKLVETAYNRAWWFRLAREPLRAGMLALGKVYGIAPAAYSIGSAHCGGCPRIIKCALKERSAIFRAVNAAVNPVFDHLMEILVSSEDIHDAKDFAARSMRGGDKEQI